MEEKNGIKINLTKLFIIIAFIVIAVIAVILFFMHNRGENEEKIENNVNAGVNIQDEETSKNPISKNEIFSRLGLEKVNKNYDEIAIDINKTIQTENFSVELVKLAYDNALLILEYNINLTASGLERVRNGINDNRFGYGGVDYQNSNRYIIGEDAIKTPIASVGINKDYCPEYAMYSERISEGVYKQYEVVSVLDEDIKNVKDLKAKITLSFSALVGNLAMQVATENNIECLLIDLTVNENDTDNNAYKIEKDNLLISIDKVINTNFACFMVGKINLLNVSSSEFENGKNPNNFSFNVLDENGKKIETECDIYNCILKTENDEEIDISDYERIKKEKSSSIFNLNNFTDESLNEWYMTEDFTSTSNLNFEKGTVDSEFIILLPSGAEKGGKIKFEAVQDGNKVDDGIEIELKENNAKCTVKNITIASESDRITRDYWKGSYANDEIKLKNDYYTADAEKIDLTNFSINGLKLGMNYDETFSILRNMYAKKDIEVNEEKINEIQQEEGYAEYNDNYINLEFDRDRKLISIDIKDTKISEFDGMKEGDIIKKYYSEPEMINTVHIQDGSGAKHKVIYGKEDFKAYYNELLENNYERQSYKYDFAYVKFSGNMGHSLLYQQKNITLNFYMDPITKVINNIYITDSEATAGQWVEADIN